MSSVCAIFTNRVEPSGSVATHRDAAVWPPRVTGRHATGSARRARLARSTSSALGRSASGMTGERTADGSRSSGDPRGRYHRTLMTVMVTGASGPVGHALVPLLARKDEVRAAVRDPACDGWPSGARRQGHARSARRRARSRGGPRRRLHARASGGWPRPARRRRSVGRQSSLGASGARSRPHRGRTPLPARLGSGSVARNLQRRSCGRRASPRKPSRPRACSTR